MTLNFSVIIVTYNSEKWINECINSLIEQNICFEKNIEVIIVDNNSVDNTESICQKFIKSYPQNFKFIKNDENLGPGPARNIGLKYATGKYINFLDSDDYISKHSFKNVLTFFNKHENVDLIAIPIYFFENRKGSHYLNYKFKKTKEVNLIDNPEYYQLSCTSSFIKKEAIKNIKFPNIITSEGAVFVNEILINNPNIGLCCDAQYNYRKREDKNSIMDNSQSDKKYYMDRVENYFKYLIDKSDEKYGKVPEFVQNVVMCDISRMLKVKDISSILNTEESEKFKYGLSNVLQKIDDEIIYNHAFMEDPQKINAFLLKYGDYTNHIFSKFKLDTISIDIYDIINDELYVMANITHFNKSDVNVFINDHEIETKEMIFPQRDEKYLDYTYCKNYTFEFRLPLQKDKEFKIEFKNNGQLLKIDFSRPCNFSKVVGYAKSKNYLSITNEDNIIIKKKTAFRWIKQEIKALAHMAKERKPGYKVGIPFRLMYMLGYPFLRNKHIWFFMDRPEVADDNGMHLFNYALDKDKNIKKFFIINKDSKDYEEMKKIGNVIPFKSIKHRYLGLFVENIVTSHPDSEIIYPFWGSYPHLAGLLKSNNVFLQHGIIKDDISSWLNKFTMNLSFFLTSAPIEYESIFQYHYNYGKNVVQLLGLPRYDTLKNNEDKKQIIIMPSWRRNLERKSNDYIIKTDFFKKFNSLINNEKLIRECKNNNYEIIFRPHPNVYNFIDLFDENDYVNIDYDRVRYQTLFNNGSLLITDYSSVAFDFAYLKKPILYYHYGSDYHFDLEDSFFDYKQMGFGEVIKTEEELVDLIIEYMNCDCKIKDKYYERIEEFFLYTDRNNCKRVYDAIKKIPIKE